MAKRNFLGYLNGTEYEPQGSNFGYPHCFSAWMPEELPQNEDIRVGTQFTMGNQNGTINDTFCANQSPPRLTFQAHMAPLDIKFNNSAEEAWITFHGSWDRTDPVGYKLSVIPFANGEPVAAPDNKTAAVDILTNTDNSRCPQNCFRPVGITFDRQGRLFMSSDATGEIYMVMKDQSSQGNTATSTGASQPASPSSGARQNAAYSIWACFLQVVITQEIAVYLSDKDLASFSLVEKATWCAAIPVDAGHWRVRFREQYDILYETCSATLVADYKLRKRFLSPQTFFKLGHSPEEIACLVAIRQLINEGSKHTSDSPPKNCMHLWKFMKQSNLLFDAFRWVHAEGDIAPQVNPLLMTIQVFFFTWNLYHTADPYSTATYPAALRQSIYHIKWSQDAVLTTPEMPLVDGYGIINMGLLLHLTNFWRFHLTLNDEGKLWHIYSGLGTENWPIAGYDKLEQDRPVFVRNWKGAMFNPAPETTSFKWRGHHNNDVHLDGFYTGGEDPLDMNVVWADETVPWPEKFEKVVKARPTTLKRGVAETLDFQYATRTLKKPSTKKVHPVHSDKSTLPGSDAGRYHDLSFCGKTDSNEDRAGRLQRAKATAKVVPFTQFFGNCDEECGDRNLNIVGIVHGLPPQSGIPEWQRITMVTYETPHTGTASMGYLDAPEDDLKICSHFEGVVCPGGAVMLGRWHIGEEYDLGRYQKNGPFIFWNTENVSRSDFTSSSYTSSTASKDDSKDNNGQSINHGDQSADDKIGECATQTSNYETPSQGTRAVPGEEEDDHDDEEKEDIQYWLAALNALHEG
ncbi:MAG: hypothetical protein Q9216_001496 [Gyalolechia sp. 2 TL-2023]